ncbi:MAG: hypothetical protein ABIK43_06840 [candidate division WOR-3 bacterium]
MISRNQLSRMLSKKVRQAFERYEAKTRPARVRSVLNDIRPEMCKRLQTAMDELALVNITVRQVSEESSAPACLLPFLLSYGRYVYGRWRRLKPGALTAELEITDRIWQQRGLEPLLLARVRERVLTALKRLRAPV